ncbi:hypothetical protein ACQ4PT_060883 [Festuca glaucescens]
MVDTYQTTNVTVKFFRIFWDEFKVILDITKPLYMVIKFSDGEGPKAGDIYEKMDNMLGQIKEVMTKEDNSHRNDWNEVETIIIERWGKMNWSFHCLAFALSPKYYDQAYLATPAPGGGQRKAPNEDTEVIQGVMDALNRIAEDENEFALLREEFNTFIMKKGLFAIAAVQADAATMNAIDWWFNYGSQTPHLNEAAKKVLSQPLSSSSAERNWSTYSFIHSVKRNPLNAKTADKLVYIHANERLNRRFSEGYNSGPHYKWDVDPDNSLLEDSSLKLEQLRWASLEDEPAEVEPPRKLLLGKLGSATAVGYQRSLWWYLPEITARCASCWEPREGDVLLGAGEKAMRCGEVGDELLEFSSTICAA